MSSLDTRTTSLTDATWQAGDDGYLSQPYVDVDELREQPVPHRYVHGGFEGTDSRFSFYFPPVAQYHGRFFQHVTPVPQSENLAPLATGEEDRIGFSAHSGAYFVETNGGGPKAADPFSGMDPTIGAYRVSAEAAKFSRHVARAVYGEHRPYGYLYGGSGGSFRTIGASENTTGVWDGFVPYVIATPMAIPNNFSVRMLAQRVLRDRFDAIADAYDAGGDPAALELTDDERAVFTEVSRFGFPPRSWFGWRTMGMHGFSALYPGVMAADPSFADDFWSIDGYDGADPASSIHRDRIRLSTRVSEVVDTRTEPARPQAGGVDESFRESLGASHEITALRMTDAPDGWALGAILKVTSGRAEGTVLRLSAVEGDIAHLEPGQNGDALRVLAPGDEVFLDNSSFLAAQTYHRHQIPGPEYVAWDQFRGGGEAAAPQRPMLLGPLFAAGAGGSVSTGAISGKMIAVLTLLDREAFPWHGDWFAQRVREHLGDEFGDRFRLWYVDNAIHGDSEEQEFPTRTVSYLGALQTALRQVSAWVERGESPAADSAYDLVDAQVLIPDAATERGGIQPVVALTVDGADSVTVAVGQPVAVRVLAAAPAPGRIVEIRLDENGSGILGDPVSMTAAAEAAYDFEVVFTGPGTYFVAARVTAQTAGDAGDVHARVHNIARARVVVTG